MMAAWMTMNHLWLAVPAAALLPAVGKSRLRLLMKRNSISGGESSSSTGVEEVPIKPKGAPPSLISAVNVEKALRGIAITDEDHYGRLGVERGCSSDEVRIAYQNKVLEYLEKNQQQSDDGLELLKESYGILCTDEERRLYDWSLARKKEDMRYMWPFEVDKIRPLVSSDNAPPLQPPEDHHPTKWLAYFLAAWFFLSIILFILFNS
ncbi:NAD(P)H-quinone oxidoreductase subunit U, chloroplastic [Henckelia pumila]|uniref:NAD(P)H-quinone oxidoreductase subunit U, chloroplastic n=1 Tax=Henckelia pumila TaxID=405737 RepID=UPI003C6E1855